MPIPELETDRLTLTSFTNKDAQDVYSYGSNPNVAKYTAWHPHGSISDSMDWIEFALSRQNTKYGTIHYPWAIRTKGNGAALGCITFSQTSESTGRIDYVLNESEWNKGIMAESAKRALEWVFDNIPEIETVESGCLSINKGSCALLKKLGFSLLKTELHHFDKFREDKMEVSYFSLERNV